MSPEDIHAGLARTRLLALDVDGVLTDGRVVYAGEREIQSFHVHDGQGLVWLKRVAGVELAIITGRGCEATRKRAAELGVQELHMLVAHKEKVLAEIQTRLGIDVEATVAVGDDLPDLALARRAGLFVSPRNARTEVRDAAHLVTEKAGGRGCVRELAEAILRAKGLWEEVVSSATAGAR